MTLVFQLGVFALIVASSIAVFFSCFSQRSGESCNQ